MKGKDNNNLQTIINKFYMKTKIKKGKIIIKIIISNNRIRTNGNLLNKKIL
jgi:hypothetical protein